MNKISRLPQGAMIADKTGQFNPNLVRHLKQLGDCAAASTAIQTLDALSYNQSGCQITIHLSQTYNGPTDVELPFAPAFDSYLDQYTTVSGAVTRSTIAVVKGKKTINVGPGAIVVTGNYMTDLGDSQ